ncbi:hypothetical protein Pyn_41044 [Prunus yedoensis var. nudiflora]|uniref:Uncharacterized protein n=1 Tax=Prunus yedoensis var. nudiflora TaxID=2094558 RepID=A0A314UMK8_PRUYE|nr:hypothetical protein Pyn_41044 [Prunus yedoensis var. nudiflora]
MMEGKAWGLKAMVFIAWKGMRRNEKLGVMLGMAAGMLAAAECRKEGGLMVAGVLEQPRDFVDGSGMTVMVAGMLCSS